MRMDVYSDDGSVVSLASRPQVQYYRVPHDIERYNVNLNDKATGMLYIGWRTGPVRSVVIQNNVPLPEVFRLLPDHQTPLYDRWIRLWRAINDELDDDHFCRILDNALFLTNKTGWPGRRNIILGRDLDNGFPAFHAPIVTGGAIFAGTETRSLAQGIRDTFAGLRMAAETGVVQGLHGYIIASLTETNVLKIDNLRVSDPAPTKEQLLAQRHLWFEGTAVTPSGRVNNMVKKGIDGQMKKIRVPFITKEPVYVPLGWVHKLDPGFIPPSATWLP